MAIAIDCNNIITVWVLWQDAPIHNSHPIVGPPYVARSVELHPRMLPDEYIKDGTK